jgi:GAF domain-containing protein
MSSPTSPASDGQVGPSRSAALLEAALALGTEHDLEPVLQCIVESAATVAEARYSALGRYDEHGEIRSFVHHGVDPDTAARIGHLPRGRGLLGEVIVADGPIRLDDLAADPRAWGFPPHHPPMRSFLGVPLVSGGRRYGNLYLTEKRGGRSFDEEDERLTVALAAFAAAAIENALLLEAERERAGARAELAAARERERPRAEMLARVLGAQEAERGRVARDLHDEIGQDLTSVLLGLRLVETSLAGEPPDLDGARKHSTELRGLVTDALGDVRRLAFELRPTVLDDVGLLAAVQRLAADVAARHGLTYQVKADGLVEAERLPAESRRSPTGWSRRPSPTWSATPARRRCASPWPAPPAACEWPSPTTAWASTPRRPGRGRWGFGACANGRPSSAATSASLRRPVTARR